MSLAHGGDRPFERIGGLGIAKFVVEEEGFVAFPVVVFELEVLHAGGWVGGVIGSAVAGCCG